MRRQALGDLGHLPRGASLPIEARLHVELGRTTRRWASPASDTVVTRRIPRARAGDRGRRDARGLRNGTSLARSTTRAGSAAWIGSPASRRNPRRRNGDARLEVEEMDRGPGNPGIHRALAGLRRSRIAAWDRLKTLVGDWKGAYVGADQGADGMGEVRISYRLVSNGTTLMETMDSGHDTSMVTMYHVDGSRILATHYCAAGNQPRMAAAGLSPDGKTLSFHFVDATNVTPDSEVMQRLVVTFDGPTASSRPGPRATGAKGQDQVGTFTYSRVR